MLILAVSPGPGVFATTATALSLGYRKTIPVIGGIIIGDIVFLLLAVFGLSFVATVLGDLFFVIRIAGGVYLILLGIKVFLTKPAI